MNALVANSFSRRRGVALITALFAVVLLGMCLALLAAAFSYELRLPRIIQNRGQLQAMLLSGGTALENRLLSGKTAEGQWSLNLPPQLSDNGGQIRIDCKNPSSNKLIADVFASYAGATARQTLTFARNGNAWQLENIALGPNAL
ncbi:MAG TPA: hypothetical protein VMG59_12015 [Phycisphaerae bacterium]|nr:hypothetical protein [Phycisphaerae bacterium]